MNYTIMLTFAIIVPYLICSINPAIIAAKIKSGKDIREMGSGNPGLTNTLRTMGKGAAAVVLLFDVLKGVISILLIRYVNAYFMDMCDRCYFIGDTSMWIGALSGVLGHCYPIYYKFKGGKAALVTVATGMAIDWLPALIALSVFILIVLITKYVSLGSVIAAASYAASVGLVLFFVRNSNTWYISLIFSSAIAVIIIFKHKDNIKRLIAGNEKKLGEKK